MKHIASANAKNQFGQLLDMAQKEPVTIEKKGRAVAVILSIEDFSHFLRTEDQLWAMKAEKAAKEGFLGNDESEKFLNDLK